MLQLKSFKMRDDKGMNELLNKYRLAPGASIMVSNGEIVIPFEDGEGMNKQHKINYLLEEKQKMVLQYELLDHAQKVLVRQIDGANQQIDKINRDIEELDEALKVAPNPDSKENYMKVGQKKLDRKALISKRDSANDFIVQNSKIITLNNSEMTRMEDNFKVYDEVVRQLEE